MAKILVIDSEINYAKFVKSILHEFHYKTKVVHSINDMIDTLELNAEYDLIVASADMSHGSASKLMSRLNSIYHAKNIPVIFYTESADKETLNEIMELGTKDVILKPIKPKTLIYKIEKALIKNKPVILLAEDEPVVRDRLKYLIELGGYAVFTARTGKDAGKIIAQNNIAVVITDIGLPDMTGPEFVICMKNKYPSLPILLVTGLSKKHANAARLCGADGQLSKPYRNTEIIDKLKIFVKPKAAVKTK